ncbi:MAG: hypothetical protein AAF985_07400 [Bacteroidota bacterium]
MKKCLFLQVFLLLMAIQLTANSPGEKTSGKPLPKSTLPLQSLMSDWGADPEKWSQPDTAQVEQEKEKTKAQQRFAFPELDQKIMASIEAALPMPPPDDMSNLLETELSADEKAGLQAIEAAQLGGTHVDNFDDLLNLKLPAYRIQKIGNLEAIIVINSLKLTTKTTAADGLTAGGRLGLYVGIKIPQKRYDSQGRKKNITLIFGTEGLAFTHAGNIQTDYIRLVNDVGFEVGGSSRKAVVMLKNGDPQNETGTYIKFGCDGVEEFAIGADVHFSKDWLLPLDAAGYPTADGPRVQGNFQTVVQDWNNLLASVNLENFALAKWDKMTFSIGNAHVDLSDYKNPAAIKYPEGYDMPNPAGLWRGVYIETIEITFPEPFKRKCDGSYGESNDPNADACRMKIAAKDLLIDNLGVTGKFSISGEAPIVSGALMNKKWSWSLNTIGLELVQSRFEGFSFNGGIVIPLTKRNTPFSYKATVHFTQPDGNTPQEANYNFNIELGGDVEFPVFNAFKVKIGSSSMLNIAIEDGEFKPSAVLYGDMTIGKGDPSKEDVRVPMITFEHIQLQTEGNFINGGKVYIQGGGGKVNNFPVQISGVGIGFGQNEVYLDFDLGVHLMKQEDGGLTASGSFKIFGKLETNVIGAHQWRFHKFTMDGFTVKIDLPVVKGCGALTLFKEDPVYGNGFSAYLDAKILGKDSDQKGAYTCGADIESAFSLSLAAVFGNKDGMRFFMLDGYVSSDKLSVPLPPTPLSLTGFGGGAFYRMKITEHSDSPENGNAIPAGMDTSGLIYEPDPGTLFGLKFAVGITTTGIEATGGSPINGKLAVIVRFGNGLSLQNITFWGTAELINPLGDFELPDIDEKIGTLAISDSERQQQDADEMKNAQDKIMAKMGISLDFDGGFSYHGYAEVNLSAASGKLTGSGQLDLLIDPGEKKWHLYIGGYENEAVKVPDFFNPENSITMYPVSVTVDYGALKVVASAYFLLGNDIPGPPPINAAAANFFDISTSANAENRELLYCNGKSPANGTGVAFGASLTVKLEKEIKKKILFKKVTIVDIKVNGGAGFDIALLQYGPGTACQNGQSPHGLNNFRATGTIWGYIDVNGKVLGVRLPSIGVGALLQADIPNPSFFRAMVVLKFIKEWKFKFKIGDECGHPCSVADG